MFVRFDVCDRVLVRTVFMIGLLLAYILLVMPLAICIGKMLKGVSSRQFGYEPSVGTTEGVSDGYPPVQTVRARGDHHPPQDQG